MRATLDLSINSSICRSGREQPAMRESAIGRLSPFDPGPEPVVPATAPRSGRCYRPDRWRVGSSTTTTGITRPRRQHPAVSVEPKFIGCATSRWLLAGNEPREQACAEDQQRNVTEQVADVVRAVVERLTEHQNTMGQTGPELLSLDPGFDALSDFLPRGGETPHTEIDDAYHLEIIRACSFGMPRKPRRP